MKRSKLSIWLKLVILGVGICAAIVFYSIIPNFGKSVVYSAPEFEFCYLPWLTLTILISIPCFLALVFAWKISSEIGKDNAFCRKNASSLKIIAILSLVDVGIFFVGNIVLVFLGANHPGILIGSLLVDFIGVAIATVFFALSHLVLKAVKIKEEAEGII